MLKTRSRVFVAAVAVLVSLSFCAVDPPPAGAAAADATCSFSGLINISPGLTTEATPQTITFANALIGSDAETSCPLAPMGTSASVTGAFTSSSLHCRDGESKTLVTDSPIRGRMKITWPDSPASIWRTQWTLGQSAANSIVFRGKVTNGTYASEAVRAHVDDGILKGSCLSGHPPVTQLSFFAFSNEQAQRLLSFIPS